MSTRVKKALKFSGRWGIAIIGIYWVISNMSLDDRVLVQGPDGWPESVALVRWAKDTDPTFNARTGDGKETVIAQRDLIAKADREKVILNTGEVVAVLGLKVLENEPRGKWPLVVARPRNLWQRYWNVHNEP